MNKGVPLAGMGDFMRDDDVACCHIKRRPAIVGHNDHRPYQPCGEAHTRPAADPPRAAIMRGP